MGTSGGTRVSDAQLGDWWTDFVHCADLFLAQSRVVRVSTEHQFRHCKLPPGVDIRATRRIWWKFRECVMDVRPIKFDEGGDPPGVVTCDICNDVADLLGPVNGHPLCVFAYVVVLPNTTPKPSPPQPPTQNDGCIMCPECRRQISQWRQSWALLTMNRGKCQKLWLDMSTDDIQRRVSVSSGVQLMRRYFI